LSWGGKSTTKGDSVEESGCSNFLVRGGFAIRKHFKGKEGQGMFHQADKMSKAEKKEGPREDPQEKGRAPQNPTNP